MKLSLPILCTALGIIAGVSIHAQGNTPARTAQGSLAARPPCYVENRGQWDIRARFLLRTHELDTWITDDGVVYDSYHVEGTPPQRDGSPATLPLHDLGTGERRVGDVVQMRFLGTTAPPQWGGVEAQETHYNYYSGSDRTRWHTGVHAYAEAYAAEIYRGIDARFYVDGAAPRYDVVVHPGSDPASVRLGFEGARSVMVANDTTLVIGTSRGAIVQRGLTAWQDVAGTRQRVSCRFVAGGGEVRFALGAYDRARPVVIDPVVYATLLAGTDDDLVYGIAPDQHGDIVVCGHTTSADFPTTTGPYQAAAQLWDAFTGKLSADCRRLLFSTVISGSNNVSAADVVVDGAGNMYVAGITTAANFPTTSGSFDSTPNGYIDGFVMKLDSAGTMLFAAYVGGSGYDNAEAIALDSAGNIYLTGITESADFPTTAGAFDRTKNDTGSNHDDAYVMKIAGDGSTVVYSTFMGGSATDYPYGIAVDKQGQACIVGTTNSVDFPTSSFGYSRSVQTIGRWVTNADAFVVQLGTAGAGLVYGTYLGGAAFDDGHSVAFDQDGDIYVGGSTASQDYPSTFGPPAGPGNRGVITRLRPSGLVYSRLLPGSMAVRAIALDSGRNAYAAGEIGAHDLPITAGAVSSDTGHMFVAALDSRGIDIRYCTYLGPDADLGSGGNTLMNMYVDREGYIGVAGWTRWAHLPIGGYDSIAGGRTDSYVMRFHPVLLPSGVDAEREAAPAALAIAAVPNPASEKIRLFFTLEKSAPVAIEIYALDGMRTASSRAPRIYAAGDHDEALDVSALPAGYYLVKVTAGSRSATRSMVIVR